MHLTARSLCTFSICMMPVAALACSSDAGPSGDAEGTPTDGASGETDGSGGVATGGGNGSTDDAAGGNDASGGAASGGAAAGTGGSGGAHTGSGGVGSVPDDGCPGGNQVDFSMVGYATQAGGTTGGKGGSTVTVTTGAELMAALAGKESDTPLTILIDGTITEASVGTSKIDIKDVEDLSIIGVGDGAEFDGIGLKLRRASNIVLRNLRVHHVDVGEKDAIGIEGPVDHVWVDHCELYAEFDGVDKDDYDGLLDTKADAEYITYSWNYLHDSWKTMLVGSSESDTHDRKITAHHNFFENCNSRLPLYRGGTGHFFNNYYENVSSTAINARIEACLAIESNYFVDVQNPWVSAYSSILGGGDLSCNEVTGSSSFSYSDDVQELPSCTASIPYDSSAVFNHVSLVPSIVQAHAGVGKLTDPTQF